MASISFKMRYPILKALLPTDPSKPVDKEMTAAFMAENHIVLESLNSTPDGMLVLKAVNHENAVLFDPRRSLLAVTDTDFMVLAPQLLEAFYSPTEPNEPAAPQQDNQQDQGA